MTESFASDVVAPGTFRSLMAEFPSGVAVVTAMDDGVPWGMTCSSLCSVSVSPPTLLVCLRAQSPTLSAILRRGAFAANLLHGGAREVAELFSSSASARFDRVRWTAGPGGPHLREAAHAIADCRVSRVEDAGTHLVVFGEVFDSARHDGHAPLLYGRRGYHRWPG
ncbi:flavin reductase family protein [Amycolatopsis silviterrae]|uniref:Flavin reductase family protein n=1 Tax=Amycolatopsis silviterrae TaxID=1656914 RepID=A0ABW5H2R7_9PSEU